MKPKSTPEAPTKETQWLYCTDRGMGRAEKMPNFKWTGDLRPAKISHDERYFRGMLAVPEKCRANGLRRDFVPEIGG
jgi:methionyl aminopeptidase